MEKLTKALMTDETGQAIVTKLTALSGQMHELAMATRGSAVLFESESDISVLGDGGYLAVYVGSTNPLEISDWTGDNSLVTGHLYYLIKSGTAVASSDLGEYGGTAVTDTTLAISGAAADAKAVGDALADFTIEVDDTLTEQGKAADAKAVGDALAEKADSADVETEINSLDERVTALEGGGDDVYEDRGDVYTLLSSLEDVTMKKTDYRLNYNSSTQAVTEQSYTSGHPAIHYIPKSALIEVNYPRLWIHRSASTEWSMLADYDPEQGTYTALLSAMPAANNGKLVRFENIADGHYLAVSSPASIWKTGSYIYLARLYICPKYTAVHSGWDTDVCEDGKPITLEMSPIDLQYPAFYIDMQKHGDCLVRLVNSGTGTTTWNFIAMSDYMSYDSIISNNIGSYFSMGDFSAWYYDARYLTFFFRTRIDQVSIKLTMGYVPIENARKCKEVGKWGAQFALHNCDTPNELIFACSIGSILDIDVCRTLDGYFVCIHNTTINGHTIASTNLEDMELTYNQMEVTRALKVMRKYGVTCYFNFRETTSEQALGLTEKAYNYLGRAIVYDDQITGSGSVLANHLDKYYTWASGQSLDTLVNLGAKPGRIFANASHLEGTSYTKADIIQVKGIASGETLSNYAWDGECAYLWIHNDTPGFVRG